MAMHPNCASAQGEPANGSSAHRKENADGSSPERKKTDRETANSEEAARQSSTTGDLFAPAHSPFRASRPCRGLPSSGGLHVPQTLDYLSSALGASAEATAWVLTISAKMRRRPTKKWHTSEVCPYLFKIRRAGTSAATPLHAAPLKWSKINLDVFPQTY